MKNKISQFEFAIMEAITPETTKDYEPRTDAEELNLRQENLLKHVKNLNIGGVVCSDLSDDDAIAILENCPFEESGYYNTKLQCRFKLNGCEKDDNGCELAL